MLKEYQHFQKIYIATEFTDLRKRIDGLASIVKMEFHLSPYQKDVLLLFYGKWQDYSGVM